MTALDTQVDGTHYTDMKMQPLELSYILNASPCFCKLAKYLTRVKGDKLVNLQKAKHCIELERDLSQNNLGCYGYEDINFIKHINNFTEDKDIRKALTYMYESDYTEAIEEVGVIISKYSEE